MHLNQDGVDFDAQLSIFGVQGKSSVNVLDGVTWKDIIEIEFLNEGITDLNWANCKFVFAGFNPVKNSLIRMDVGNFIIETETGHIMKGRHSSPVKLGDGRNIFAPINNVLLFGRRQARDNRGVIYN